MSHPISKDIADFLFDCVDIFHAESEKSEKAAAKLATKNQDDEGDPGGTHHTDLRVPIQRGDIADAVQQP